MNLGQFKTKFFIENPLFCWENAVRKVSPKGNNRKKDPFLYMFGFPKKNSGGNFFPFLKVMLFTTLSHYVLKNSTQIVDHSNHWFLV